MKIEIDTFSGDIGLSTSNDWMAKVIKFMTSWHTVKASKSHAFIMVSHRNLVEATNKIRINPISKYNNPVFTEVDIYRLPLLDKERINLRLGLLRQINKVYGYTKLPLFALDAICTRVVYFFGYRKPIFFFTKIFGIFNIPVCSQLVIWAIHKFTSYEIRDKEGKKVNWRVISPDFLEDLLKLDHNGAIKIFSKEE